MIKKLNRTLEIACMTVAGLAICLMALVAFLDSIGRKLGLPLPGGNEIVSHLLMLFFFASIPLVIKADAHIRVGLFTDFYSPLLQRIERFVTQIIEIVAMLVFSWMIYDQAGRLFRFETTTVYFEMAVAPWVYAAFGFTLIACWFAVQTLFGPQSQEPLAQEAPGALAAKDK
ncbi:C4-dicarboxylate ABC transporter permease [Gemmobacter aquaticus]|uniref:TRAP transporter small permease protein n=1 Tax=Gemmobacter aquaticus TaxID=490185 RepID=A0A918DEG4_9RHOB|nr:TRAP transporter small permease subunit [Gemmobacter aquaticus]GGO38481.1 C4-dicarboxylate ABC transporter permease [Gemmobacter aquaticus]